MGKQVEFKVVGLTFRPGYPESIFQLQKDLEEAQAANIREGGDGTNTLELLLIRDPANPHDANAVEVHAPTLGKGRTFFGFVPADLAAKVAPTMDRGDKWRATVKNVLVKDGYERRPGVEVILERLTKAE